MDSLNYKPPEASFVISTAHHPKPIWLGTLRIALRKDGKGFDVLDLDANPVFSDVLGSKCYDWAYDQVQKGKRYK